MQDCGLLEKVVLISKAGNGKYVCHFPCFKVLPFCSPLRVMKTMFLLFTFQLVVFADDFVRKL